MNQGKGTAAPMILGEKRDMSLSWRTTWEHREALSLSVLVGVALTLTVIGLFLMALRRRTKREEIQRRIWRRFYDRLSFWYDAVDWLTLGTTHRLRRHMLHHLPPPGARLLEVGFGTGRLHVELARCYRMAGLDLAFGMVKLTRIHLSRLSRRSHLCQGDMTRMPWRDNTFDAVFSTFALSAVPDAQRAIEEMARVTRPGGRVIITDAGEAPDGNLAAHLLAKLWEFLGDYIRDEAPIMRSAGLDVHSEAFGPWNCIHTVVGLKPNAPPAAQTFGPSPSNIDRHSGGW